jgi:hypothetical protein
MLVDHMDSLDLSDSKKKTFVVGHGYTTGGVFVNDPKICKTARSKDYVVMENT